MHARCRRGHPKGYADRGIAVCARWSDFTAFAGDVGEPPTTRHSLDRINNDGDYEPGNVRWATNTEQARNRRNSRRVAAFGETRTIPEWVAHPACAVSADRLYSRLVLLGWDPHFAICVPARGARK
jgi:hypothetical protein